MNTTTKATIVFLAAAAAFEWTHAAPAEKTETSPTVSEIATGFTNYVKVTKEVAFVNFDLLLSCRGATQEEMDAARAKYGPHANAGVLIYMSKSAADAFGSNASAYPVGSVIVKQKTFGGHHGNDGKWIPGGGNGVGGMVKRPAGYDPTHGDWEYFYFEDPKKIDSGRIASCVQCHDSAKEKDHVFGTWRGTTK
jgi:hypothetical protein